MANFQGIELIQVGFQSNCLTEEILPERITSACPDGRILNNVKILICDQRIHLKLRCQDFLT